MEGSFDVFLKEQAVGSARVYTAGLYTCFSCRCRIPNGEKLHLKVSCGESVVDLGLCIPMDDCFGVETKIASKKLAEGTWLLYLGDRKQAGDEQIELGIIADENPREEKNRSETEIPFEVEKPFNHLSELENARIIEEADKTKIIIQDPEQDRQDSDQTPLPD